MDGSKLGIGVVLMVGGSFLAFGGLSGSLAPMIAALISPQSLGPPPGGVSSANPGLAGLLLNNGQPYPGSIPQLNQEVDRIFRAHALATEHAKASAP